MTKETPRGSTGETARPALLAYLSSSSLMVLVPKKRGNGYQRVPLGHHMTPLAELAMHKGWDITGLDGHLEIEVSCHSAEERAATLERYMPALAEFYGMPWRETSATEFWSLHPLDAGSDKGGSGATD